VNITYRCPKCGSIERDELDGRPTDVTCRRCATPIVLDAKGYGDDFPARGELKKCLVCPSKELFVRKNFPQQVGVAIVVLGFVASTVTWYYGQILATYGILFLTALIDVVLYLWVGDLIQCYLCQAQYRGFDPAGDQSAFDLETHEKYRQMSARIKESAKEAS
jgi:DNA-directed RNA polymerase subunit RPC12/RpoP